MSNAEVNDITSSPPNKTSNGTPVLLTIDSPEKPNRRDPHDDITPHNLPFIAIEQRTDPQCKQLIDYITMNKLPMNRKEARYIRSCVHSYIVDNDGILRKVDVTRFTKKGINDEQYSKPPIVLPRSLWDKTIAEYHENPISGHRKFLPLYEAISGKYYFHGMYQYILAYASTCISCAASTQSTSFRSPMQPYHSGYPGILIHLDCTKGNKETPRGNTYILAIIDSFSGYVRLYPISQPDAKTTAETLLKYICVNSMPLRIITDNGPEFANELWSQLALLLGLKQTFIAPYNSKANGKVENIHRTLHTMIRSYIDEYEDDWDLLLPLLEFAINTSTSQVTKYTPFYLHYGRHPIFPIDMLYGAEGRTPITTDEYVNKLKESRDKIIQWANRHKEMASEKRKSRYDSDNRHRMKTLKVGDYVMLRDHSKHQGQNRKLHELYYRDYYYVKDCTDNGSYLIQDIKHEKPPKRANIQDLKPIKTKHEVCFTPDDMTLSLGTTHDNTAHDSPDLSHSTSTIHQAEQYPNALGQEMNKLCRETDSIDNDVYYEVERILDHKTFHGELWFKVQWKGYKDSSAQWVHEYDMDCKDIINDYMERHTKLKKSPIKSVQPVRATIVMSKPKGMHDPVIRSKIILRDSDNNIISTRFIRSRKFVSECTCPKKHDLHKIRTLGQTDARSELQI